MGYGQVINHNFRETILIKDNNFCKQFHLHQFPDFEKNSYKAIKKKNSLKKVQIKIIKQKLMYERSRFTL